MPSRTSSLVAVVCLVLLGALSCSDAAAAPAPTAVQNLVEPCLRALDRAANVARAATRADEGRNARGFNGLVLGLGQIAAAPNTPCWTIRHTGILLGGVMASVALALGWIRLLRRQVRHQTEVIRQQLRERDEFAESLAREKALLATLIDHLPDLVFVKDAGGKYLLTNLAHSQFHRASPKSFIGKSSADVLPAELAEAYTEVDRKILTGEVAIFNGQEPSRTANGSPRWLTTTKVPLKDESGKIIGLVGIGRDVTEWKLAMAQLAYERDLLQTLMDNLPDPIHFKDLESRFVRVSKSKLRNCHRFALLRHRAEHGGNAGPLPEHLQELEHFEEYVLGHSDADFCEPGRAQEAHEDEQTIIRTRTPMIGKLERAVSPDGKTSWSLVTKMPWIDKDGKVIGTFGSSKDITSIKEAEAKLEEVHRDLIIASRQAGMAEVATSVLHNVGNVLNSVNVSSSLLRSKLTSSKASNLGLAVNLMREHAGDLGRFLAEDPKGSQLLGYLSKLAEHLTAERQAVLGELDLLTSNIEHIKEIVSMQQSYAKASGLAEKISPVDLVEDALRMNSGALARHDVKVRREYQEGLPEITVEKHKVLQVLVNLIRNAKYACDESGRQGKELTVQLRNGDDRLRIAVIDNGVGIPPENMNRIFNHGFTTRQRGHGFGLHSGALAAHEMGGTLTAHSDGVGRGATFTLELPLQPRNP